MAADEDAQHEATETSSHPELLAALWPLFFIGKMLGMIHLRRTGYSEVVYDPKTKYTILSIVFLSTYIVFYSFAIVMSVSRIEDEHDGGSVVEQLMDLVYITNIFLNMIFCMYQSRKFPELFQYWAVMEKKLSRLESLVDFDCCNDRGIRTRQDCRKQSLLNPVGFKNGPGILPNNLKKPKNRFSKNHSDFVVTSWILTWFSFSFTFLGGTIYFAGQANRELPTTAYEFFIIMSELYIPEELSTWWAGVYIFIVGHIMDVSWAYGNMLIFLFSYTLRHNYQRLNRTLEIIKDCHPSVPELEHLRVIHWDLALGIRKADASLGVITTGSFTLNIIFFFGRVYVGLADDFLSPFITIVLEAGYAFTELVFRIFGTAVVAARLHDESERTLGILMEFPDVNESVEHYLMLERFRDQVSSGKIALTGNGFFTLNRNYLISVLSALVTYEVIILQNTR